MLGVVINAAAIIIGSLIGLIFKNKISKKVSDAVMVGLGVCILYIGIKGSLDGENFLIIITSIVLGIIVGTILKIDESVNKFAENIEKRFKKEGNTQSISEGMVTGTLLFCIGAMAVTGSIEAGLAGNNSILITKAILDFVSSIMLAASLGKGVIFSGISVFIVQGSIVLLASIIAPYITDLVINEITCVGSLLIILIGTNLMGITKIKVADFLPAIIFTPLIYYFSEFIMGLL